LRPPFEITAKASSLLSEIERLLGRHEGSMAAPASPMLRRSLQVRTIQASLAIEGNTLTEEQVTAVLEGKRVIAPERDLREVRNAISCYEGLTDWNPNSTKHLLSAHKRMMDGLVDRPGAWRNRGVGIAKGNVISHIAPPAERVPGLMGSLLDWLKRDQELPLPIRAAVCHYELEFIHPFQDGNGRIGRLWHTLILFHHHPLFAQVPVESVVRDRQADYYAVLGRCDNVGKSTEFIEFALEVTLEALSFVVSMPVSKMSAADRIEAARVYFGGGPFSRKDYLARFAGLSPATGSRDLQQAVAGRLLEREGDKATARYRFC
jgi:Fic family protein